MIRCKNSPLHPQWLVGRVQTSEDRKKERKEECDKTVGIFQMAATLND